ncbi:MAG: hypothetical protein HY907_03565 [Deltaproteobacteria bacterium]|nr:hypothetical protein [Deltaproteobacteria bacterium]
MRAFDPQRRLRPLFGVAVPAVAAAAGSVAAAFLASPVAEPADGEPWGAAFSIASERAGGMAFDGSRLWLVDRGSRELLALDPATGEVRDRLPAPGPWPEGLAWDGKLLWVADSEEKKIYGVSPGSRLVEQRFDSPVDTPQGLAWDGEGLWLADGTRLQRIASDDGTTIVSVPAPGSGGDRGTEMLGLAWQAPGRGGAGGWLWVADRTKDRIYRVSPGDGLIVDMFPSSGPYPVGAAILDGRLLVADRDQRRVDAVELGALPAVVRTDPRRETVTFVHEVVNFGPGTVRAADVWVAVPEERENQTFAGEPRFDPEPAELVTDRWGQRSARFRGADLGPNESLRVTMTVELTTWAVRWHIDPDRVGGLSAVPGDIRARYTKDGSKFRIDDEVIRDAVDEALGDERNLYRMVRRIARYIQDHMVYELSGGWNVAPAVLERGNGSCSEYTFVFLAMCHAAGIPARYVGSIVVRGDDASTDTVFHRWPEVYYPGYGWVPADVQAGDSALPEKQADAMMALPAKFLITTQGAGDSEHLGWNYNSNASWSCEGYCKVVERVWGDWSPDRDGEGVDSIAAGE